MNKHGAIPDGYELVAPGEVYMKGDLFWVESQTDWAPRTVVSIGRQHTDSKAPTIRKKPVVTSPAPIPEGYRMIEAGELISSGDMFWSSSSKEWIRITHRFGKEVPKEWLSIVIKRIKNPPISTMEHQDGATTTTVSVGDVQSKFERNGREYEITDITEVVSSTGRRDLLIKAAHNPAWGQSPMKPAMDALDAVAEASKMLENRPTPFEPWSREVRKYKASQDERKQEIASIIKSVMENLS